MRKPDGVIEIFLQPGEHYFGDRYTRIRTVLGSCVSLVFWHPRELIGGMCHYMLPSRGCRARGGPDGRYADEAVALMLAEIHAAGAHSGDFRVRVFGGGNMFPDHSRRGLHIGQKNVDAARELVRAHCLHCVATHVAGVGHRNLLFDIWSGHVTMKQSAIAPAQPTNKGFEPWPLSKS